MQQLLSILVFWISYAKTVIILEANDEEYAMEFINQANANETNRLSLVHFIDIISLMRKLN